MRSKQLRKADLNLLVVFTVFAEERNVARAARRLLLTQPAATRALRRLRNMFHDELLVRVSGAYELTAKGQLLQQQLEATLPRLDRLLIGGDFLPAQETMQFRLVGSDHPAYIIATPLAKLFLEAGENLSFQLSPLSDDLLDDLGRGKVDLLFHPDDSRIPSYYERQALFEDDFVCLVDRKAPFAKSLTLKQYLEATHIALSTFGGIQTLPDLTLAAKGLKRRISFSVPYFAATMEGVVGTKLMATVPRSIALLGDWRSEVRVLEAPKELRRFTYYMLWHPRLNRDAAHIWLRRSVQKVTEIYRVGSHAQHGKELCQSGKTHLETT